MEMKRKSALFILVALVLCMTQLCGVALAEQVADPSPAVYVAQVTANSVVGVRSSVETWSQQEGQKVTPVSSGSGVVVKDGGYVLTNYHVVEDCNVFEVLLPNGEYVEAELVGSDNTLDIAVLKAQSNELVTCQIGSVSDMLVGSTVVAIGNPGGETLANTVTQGIISALERDLDTGSQQRAVSYIQHDASISSGNSGGGLFDYRGRLIGINTLKYAGSAFSSSTYEGLGFALPIDTVLPLVEQIIEYGKVIRPQLGIYTLEWSDGPEDPLDSYPPVSVLVAEVVEGGPAEAAGIQMYDFITAIDGERVKSYRELTTVLDQHEAGDTVTLTVVRYGEEIENFLSYYYGLTTDNTAGGIFGLYRTPTLSGYEIVDLQVTLEIMD